MKLLSMIFLLSITSCTAVAPAFAQQAKCADRATLIEHLSSNYGEVRFSYGLSLDNTVFELFASPESGTWTLLFTQPSGVSCLAAAGNNFQQVYPEQANDDEAL